MNVLIKGMEMPSCCMFCPISNFSGCGLMVLMTTEEMLADRPDWCPLVPVPPHGRLIDADRMRESIRMQTGLLRLMGGKFSDVAEMIEKGFLQEIDNAPTIIPAEEGET